MKYRFIFLFLLSGMLTAGAQEATFDMRWLTNDVKANGITDFHGETEWLDTDMRIESLNLYADFASKFWGDPRLDTPMFTDSEVAARTARIKPQPETSVRRTIDLKNWRSYGHKKGKETEQAARWERWTEGGAEIIGGHLVLRNCSAFPSIDTVAWRFRMRADMKDVPQGLSVSFTGTGDAEMNLPVGGCRQFEIYGDLPGRKIYLTAGNGEVREYEMSESFGNAITGFSVDAADGSAIFDTFSFYDFVRLTEDPRQPYRTRLIYDETFDAIPSMDGWQTPDYDDSLWTAVSLPSPHGSLHAEGENYYLRTEVEVGDFMCAVLDIETLDPAGEVWVNGEPAAVLKGRIPRRIDVTEYLVPNTVNTIAVKVKPYYGRHPMLHSPSDMNIGWFLGRTRLILTREEQHVTEALIHTTGLSDEEAVQHHRIFIRNGTAFPKKGQVTINYYPWFPSDGECVASMTQDILIRPRLDNQFNMELPVADPMVWSTSKPQLYRVEIILQDENGKAIDDYVTTTGIRIIEQKNGELYINHKPEMLNGAQNFGYRLPLETSSKYIRCATDDMVMRDLMMIEKLGGNMLRIHVHTEQDVVDGINDPRYAEYADQMGLYLIWQSSGWMREGEVWNVDIENFPLYMKQVYNHPSIVLWEASNHPNRFKNHPVNETVDYFNRIIPTIVQTDTSRLISPTSFWGHTHYVNYEGTEDCHGNPIARNPLLMHRMMTRGSQDAYTGYGEKWSTLRNGLYPWAKECIEARDLCYFNYEHEESAAQPNWELAEKDPWYRIQSYEWDYEKGSIGRHLQFDQWRASQAFQAFSAWESMKMQTLAGVCGFSWCCIESGANMFTYQKPLVDPYYVPKLAFYANRMVFSRIWAASDDVDTVYGPDDYVRPVIFNLDGACTVNLTIELRDSRGKVVERRQFRNVEVRAGRSVTRLEPFRFKTHREGCYFIVYSITP